MKKKYLIPAACIAAVALTLLCGTAVARMLRKTEPVENEFDTAVVDCVVQETLNGNEKTGIRVENTGNIDAYIRVRFVSYWVNTEGNIVGKASQMPPVTCTADWIAGSGDTYYHKAPVAPGGSTLELLAAPVVLTRSDEGYHQVVEVFADAIQSLPDSAATGKWGVTIENGTITAP